ncbi:MAG: GntR family transcriptional regulator, partial [Chloroflexi bacterium]
MEMVRVDTQRAYELIWKKITTLELAPAAPINDQQLAEELDISPTAVREALKLLAHDGLVVITPRHGLHVADINLPDLEELSEMRVALEGLCARMAAERATADDIAVLDALRREAETLQQKAPPDLPRLFEVDHKFHQAIAAAARNKYMARTLDQFFGLSQRLWYLALPELDFLPAAVQEHLALVEAIKAHNADQAEQIMRHHV